MNAQQQLAAAFLKSHPGDATGLLEAANPEACAELLAEESRDVVTRTLEHLAPDVAAAVLTRLPAGQQRTALAALSLGAGASLLRSLDRNERERLLQAVPEESARSLRVALTHHDESAGSMMESDVIAATAGISVGEARRRVRRRTDRRGNYLYIVDGPRKLVGAVALSKLLSASPTAPLRSLMQSPVMSLPVHATEQQILSHPGWRELHALPVVDHDGVLVGILRRETFERLRERLADRGADPSGGIGIAMAELVWTAMRSTVDGIGDALRPADGGSDRNSGGAG